MKNNYQKTKQWKNNIKLSREQSSTSTRKGVKIKSLSGAFAPDTWLPI